MFGRNISNKEVRQNLLAVHAAHMKMRRRRQDALQPGIFIDGDFTPRPYDPDDRSKYTPHNGAQEMARRVRQARAKV